MEEIKPLEKAEQCDEWAQAYDNHEKLRDKLHELWEEGQLYGRTAWVYISNDGQSLHYSWADNLLMQTARSWVNMQYRDWRVVEAYKTLAEADGRLE